VSERHLLSFGQFLAHRTVWHSERREAVWPKMTAALAFEGEAEAVGVAMPDRKAADRELIGVEYRTCRQRNQLERNGRPPFSPQPGEHPDNDVEGTRAAVNRHFLSA